jgi:hypothetical protein
MELENKKIQEFYEYIASNNATELHNCLACITSNENYFGKKTYQSIKCGEEKSRFVWFASNGCGYSNYALYNATDGKIYCLSYSMMKLYKYAVIENDTDFDPYIILHRK